MYIGGFSIGVILLVILKAVLIFFIGRVIINLVVSQIKKILEKKSVDPMLESFALSIIKFILMFILIIAILKTFNVDTTSFVAILGAATLAIGFALQGNLSNFASGVMIIMFRPFKIGDYVEAGGQTGIIDEIGIFMSTLKSLDNKKILVPNSFITGGAITNYSAYSERRVDLTVGVSYDADINHVKKTLQSVIDANEMILADKPTFVRMGEMADSSINFTVRVWTYTENYWDVYFDLMENFKIKLDEENISIPYPHVTVEMKK
jgi:small conductance mechanosensitive channel